EPERTWRNGAVLGQDCAIGEVDFAGIIADGAAIQQVPGYAVGIDRPAAENSGVEEEEPAIARPTDLGIELGHQHRLAMVNGNLRRPHLNFERHPFASSPERASRVGTAGLWCRSVGSADPPAKMGRRPSAWTRTRSHREAAVCMATIGSRLSLWRTYWLGC